MIKLIRLLFYVILFIVVTFLGLIFGDYTIAIPAIWPFGYFFVAFLIFGEMMTWIWQGKSPHVITKIGEKGYWSVNRKDIDFKPWYRNINGGKTKIGEMVIMFVGGIDYWGINPKSSSDYPVLIFPSIYLKKVGLCYDIDCNFTPFKYNELPPFIRHYLVNKYGKRIKENTQIFFGATSTIDGSSCPENDNLLEKIRAENEYVKKIEDINSDLYKELKKYDERKAKQYFIKEAGTIEEN